MLSEYQKFLESKIELAQDESSITDNVTLDGSLFPHQVDSVQWALARKRALIAASFGLGKCHGIGTPILMADGSIKSVQDVCDGDQLMGDDGTPRNVLSVTGGREEMFRVTLKNGDNYTCNKSHIFSLRVSNKYGPHRLGDIVDMPLADWQQLPEYAKLNCFKHYKVSIDFEQQAVPFDPYLYGTWLGDGHQGGLTWTINDRDTQIVDRLYAFAVTANVGVKARPERGCTTYALSRGRVGKSRQCDELYFVQSSAGADGKRIDERYLKNDQYTRLQLLAGLIDTDGHLIDKCFEIATKWEGLRDDILFLVRSLGLSVTHGPKVVNGVTYYRIYISGDTHLIPCLTRKKAGQRQQIKTPLVYGFTVESLGEGDYFGFEIDGNHRYLLGDFTVTHNTRIQIAIAKALHELTNHPFLIVCPLGVKHQFVEEDGPAMGCTWQYVRTDDELIEAAKHTPYLITNYERIRDGNIDPRKHNLAGVSLDEGAIIGNLGTITYQVFLDAFAQVSHRFVCTATPAPNDFRQLIYYADFLGVIDRGQALTRWFKRNPDKTGDLTLMPQHEEDFWLWVASFSLFLQRPSDICDCDCHHEEVDVEA